LLVVGAADLGLLKNGGDDFHGATANRLGLRLPWMRSVYCDRPVNADKLLPLVVNGEEIPSTVAIKAASGKLCRLPLPDWRKKEPPRAWLQPTNATA
ncbi:MAG TPA: hypothetical protein PLQ52_06810, partial [Lacunisphaera sp.]|nr:hypothetical protein [Lacunisphaera sp.]